jgi:hypothetical protein
VEAITTLKTLGEHRPSLPVALAGFTNRSRPTPFFIIVAVAVFFPLGGNFYLAQGGYFFKGAGYFLNWHTPIFLFFLAGAFF